jgi:serine/threonine protein kinase
VYLGEHVYLKNLVAIKILRTQVVAQDAGEFLTEAQMLVQLKHPHIVRIFEFGVEDETPYLVMEYAEQGTLGERYPKGTRLDISLVVTYMRQIGSALEYAHAQKLIHRDLKPDNLLLQNNDHILVSDFGLALIAQSSKERSQHNVSGTAHYMAPEQIRGRPVLASDQYALGIIAYQWLTGSLPFKGSFVEVCTQHLFKTAPLVREHVPGISPAVEQVIQRTLTKDPKQRFASIQDFVTALERASGPLWQGTAEAGDAPEDEQEISQAEQAPDVQEPVFNAEQTPLVKDEERLEPSLVTAGERTEAWKSFMGPSSDPTVRKPRQPEEQAPEPASPARSANQPEASALISAYSSQGANQPEASASVLALQVGQGKIRSLSDLPTLSLSAVTLPEKKDQKARAGQRVASTLPPLRRVRKKRVMLFAALLLALVLLIAGGGFSYVFLNKGVSMPGLTVFNPSAGPTTGASATHAPTGTASSQTPGATPSGQSNSTPLPSSQAHPTATSTHQASSNPTQQPGQKPTPIKASQLTPDQLYAAVMSRAPVYTSSMSAQDRGNWTQNNGCQFANGGYDISILLLGSYQICHASALSVTDFALQAQMTIRQGNGSAGGGLVFRDSGGASYRFYIGLNGSYRLDGTSITGTSSAIHTGLDQTNTLTVIAQGNLIFLYVNGQSIDQLSASTSSSGQIGLLATNNLLALSLAASVVFTNVNLWTL